MNRNGWWCFEDLDWTSVSSVVFLSDEHGIMRRQKRMTWEWMDIYRMNKFRFRCLYRYYHN
jgi:hypothetical protein